MLKQNVEKHKLFTISQSQKKEFHYKTDHNNIGIALVFNHYRFLNIPNCERFGTKTDKDSIKSALELFGFDVRLYEDLTVKEIEDIMYEVSQENHSDSDCLMVVVMSHGKNGELRAYDEYYSIEKLWIPFIDDKCKSLINKPKLFFIQACRGFGLEDTVQYKDNYPCHLLQLETVEKYSSPYLILKSPDLLVMYSCYEGKGSVRDRIIGTWFIQSLSELLTQYSTMSQEFNLYNLLTAVIQKVGYECKYYAETYKELNGKKQMPNFTSTLTKLFLIKPKIKINKRNTKLKI